MRMLICASTDFEIAPTIEFLREKRTTEVECLVTGVGMTAATYAITKAVLTSQPDFILQAGVAGSLDTVLEPGQTVLVKEEFIGDLGANEKTGFASVFDLGLLQKDEKPWTGGKLVNSGNLVYVTGLEAVSAVTVNEISTHPERIRLYRNQGARIESMEGAALHYVALKENISFLQLRSISNFVGERNKSNWQMSRAIDELNRNLQDLLTKLLNV